ncbi:MAG: ATP-binding protein [Nitrospirae bacterium YQR-1]
MEVLSLIKLPAKIESLHELLDKITAAARGFGIGDERVGDIELACEEALVNIIKYAYVEHEGELEVICAVNGKSKYVIEIQDTGIPFNVLETEDPDLEVSLMDRKIGGLGIFFVKQLMDEVNYLRDGDKNILTLTVYKT